MTDTPTERSTLTELARGPSRLRGAAEPLGRVQRPALSSFVQGKANFLGGQIALSDCLEDSYSTTARFGNLEAKPIWAAGSAPISDFRCDRRELGVSNKANFPHFWATNEGRARKQSQFGAGWRREAGGRRTDDG